MQELMLFENTQVEIIELHSIIYFNPYHVAKCLGLSDSAVRMAISKMTKNQAVKLTNSIVKDIDNYKLPPSGRLFLTESGVYKLAFKSNKPNAEAFTNWIADEVLPAIRKTGRYELSPISQNTSLTSNHPLLEQNILTLQRNLNTTDQLTHENSYLLGEHENRLETLESIQQIDPHQFELVCRAIEIHNIRIYELEDKYRRQNQILQMIASDDPLVSRAGKVLLKSTDDYKKWVQDSMIQISSKRQANTSSVYREIYKLLDTSKHVKTRNEMKKWRDAIKNDGHITYKIYNQLTKRPDRVKIIDNIFDAVCYCGETDTYYLKDVFTIEVAHALMDVGC